MGITLFDQALTGGVTLRIDKTGLKLGAFANDATWQRNPRPAPPWSTQPEQPGPLIR
jgi:hypothetical protein